MYFSEAHHLGRPAGFVPGALRIPRHMLLLRSEALKQEGSHIVAYGTTEAKSMQVLLRPSCSTPRLAGQPALTASHSPMPERALTYCHGCSLNRPRLLA